MKKLFVLFLLVSLVPFTVGCSLFGDDDDDYTPVATTRLTSTATLPATAGSNLKAAAVAASKFKGFTMSLNGVTLTAETEEVSGTNYIVTFSRNATTSELELAKQGVVPVIIKKSDATTLVSVYLNTANLTTTAPLAVTVAGDSTTGFSTTGATVGGTAVQAIASTNIVNISSISNTSGVKPTFTAVFDKNLFGTDFSTLPTGWTFDVEVRKAGGTYVDASSSDFTYSYTAANSTLSATLANKSLTVGQSYEIVIRNLTNGTTYVAAKSYTFTAAAAQ